MRTPSHPVDPLAIAEARAYKLARMLKDAGKAYFAGMPPPETVVNFWRGHAAQDAKTGQPWHGMDE